MSLNLQDVEDIFNVLVYTKMSDNGVVNSPFYFNINNIPFSPQFMIIRNVITNIDNGNDTNMYVLTNSITKLPILPFNGISGIYCPQVSIALKQAVQQVAFEIYMIDTPVFPSTESSLITATLAGDNYLTMSIDFVRMKKYDQFAISNKNTITK